MLPKLPTQARPFTQINYGTVGGENTRDLPTRINSNQAIRVENYFILGDGTMTTREGLTEKEIIAGGLRASLMEEIDSDTLIYAYDNGTNSILSTYSISDNTSAILHTFTSRDDVCGVRYGNYFYASDGTDKIGCINKEGQFLSLTTTSNWAIGEVMTEAVSGATGVVSAKNSLTGATIILLKDITGTFTGGQALTGDIAGAGTSISIDHWYEQPSAPPCKILIKYSALGNDTIVAGNTDTSDSEVIFAGFDKEPQLIPFYDWEEAEPPVAGDAGVLTARGTGQLNSIVAHRNSVSCFWDDAMKTFHLEYINVDGFGQSQSKITDFQEYNFGGYRGAISTPIGIFYANENGVFISEFGGGDKQESEISSILGEDKIKDLGFDDVEFLYDAKDRVFIFCKINGSSYNNHALVYNIKAKAWTTITGWNIRRACRIATGDVSDLWGVDSTTMRIYKLLDGFNDLGIPIQGRITMKEEVDGDATMIKDIAHIWMQGKLSSSSSLRIGFNRWNKKNDAEEDYKVYIWNGSDSADMSVWGYDITSYSGSPQGVSVLVGEDFVHKGRSPIKNYLKYQVDIQSSYESPHEFHFIQTEVIQKRRVHLNNL